jgi:Skp family chaperone for outer membrane proteins
MAYAFSTFGRKGILSLGNNAVDVTFEGDQINVSTKGICDIFNKYNKDLQQAHAELQQARTELQQARTELQQAEHTMRIQLNETSQTRT